MMTNEPSTLNQINCLLERKDAYGLLMLVPRLAKSSDQSEIAVLALLEVVKTAPSTLNSFIQQKDSLLLAEGLNLAATKIEHFLRMVRNTPASDNEENRYGVMLDGKELAFTENELTWLLGRLREFAKDRVAPLVKKFYSGLAGETVRAERLLLGPTGYAKPRRLT